MEKIEFKLDLYSRISIRKIILIPSCIASVGVIGYQYLPPVILECGLFIYLLAVSLNGFFHYKKRRKIGDISTYRDGIRFYIENRYYDIYAKDLKDFQAIRSSGTIRSFCELNYKSEMGDEFKITASQVDLGILLGYFKKVLGGGVSSEPIWLPAHLFKY
jgi:hypothetical protein